MIAVGREPKRRRHYECGTWFILKPSIISREFSLFAEERRAKNHFIYPMTFVTNDHILTQFNKIPKIDEDLKMTLDKIDG